MYWWTITYFDGQLRKMDWHGTLCNITCAFMNGCFEYNIISIERKAQ